ncbi:unnamed protein product [Phytophthora fragariaefolia]|uniref:Unnamed protein product n=1 Tax=Phytophthora fragariaefolia TaxID=1490495 RepID=A0A9W6Y1T6_9STRA|nr:unnamed protein product [Phytophthora fragariaefolia]
MKTVGNWIRVYEETGTYERAHATTAGKFSNAHRQWLCQFFENQPPAYLDEAQDAFKVAHNIVPSRLSASPLTRLLKCRHSFCRISLNEAPFAAKTSRVSPDASRCVTTYLMIGWTTS